MIHVLYTFCDQKLETRAFEHYLHRIPESMQLRIKKYRRWQDAQCGLFGKILLIEGLKKLGISGNKLGDILYTDYNRPYLDDPIDFNISHSGHGVVCAISENCRIGIDIEEINPIDISDFKRQFTEHEFSIMRAAKDTHHEFYRWWTKKEAIIKADGKGLSIPLKKIDFRNPGLAHVNSRTWQIREIPLHEKYWCHLAFAGKKDTPVKVEKYQIIHEMIR